MAIRGQDGERIYAGVLGKIIGVYLGRPFENWPHDRIMRELGPVRAYVHDRFGVPLVVTDDDIAGTFTFVRALEDHGDDPALTAERVGETWLNYIVENRTILWWGGFGISTEETAWRRLRAGISAPASGATATNGRTVAEQIGAQIFIDGWGLVSPRRPEQAARLARAAASVSHDGEAVHAAVLIAAIEALAFEEHDLDRLLEAGLAFIPPDCLIARLVADLRAWHAAAPGDWLATRSRLEAHYGYALYPGHCHVVPNHGVVIMALLHGGDDFSRALEIACTAGWDTDCNAGNVGCLNGIRLGLSGIDRSEVDWRGPVADRILLSSADGGGAVTDALTVAARLAETAHRLAGETPPPPPTARFHFSMPGSLQGFTVAAGAAAVRNLPTPDGGRCLAIDLPPIEPSGPVCVVTPTFAPPDVGQMRTYDLQACPTLHPGQILTASLRAAANDGAIGAALVILVYGADDVLERVEGQAIPVAPSARVDLNWTVPDLGGRPIAFAGVALSTAGTPAAPGTVHLERLDWRGEPSVSLRRPDRPGSFWRRAWVNAAATLATHGAEAFRIAQPEGHGLLIYGAREWRDLSAAATVAVGLGGGGIAVRVQGLRRYYALILRAGVVALIKVLDGRERLLAEAAFDWRLDELVALELRVIDGHLRGQAGASLVIEAEDRDRPLRDGAIALLVETGVLATDQVSITPAR